MFFRSIKIPVKADPSVGTKPKQRNENRRIDFIESVLEKVQHLSRYRAYVAAPCEQCL